MFSRNDIDNLAAEHDFIRDNMEKVVRLCTILEFINQAYQATWFRKSKCENVGIS